MSLILDALKRAEYERKSSENSSLVTEVISPDGPKESSLPGKNPMNWRWVLLLVIVGSILVLVFFNKQVKIDFKEKELNISTTLNPAIHQSKELTRHASSVGSQSFVENTTHKPQLVTELYEQASSSMPKVNDIQVAQLYTDNTSISSISADEIAISAAVENPLPDINDQLPRNLRTDSDVRRLVDTEATAFEELSFNQKQLFPSINYSQHNYLGNSASSVVINGELMRVGSRITQDLTLEEIVEDGVIFNFYHKRVSFKALNSWINM
jgi:Type II secretion system protein B